ncbi:hypothetical protein N7474_004868 [Penicillium riverlandense]|uniref:uncharacterized protein n=1 Tax=Penicillium riverlandense TaxID=1903569 RepID=UPI002547150D|nr:uncharacterized protein N7474_004868 [Penicillium riverlandense]KAJ5819277.1 hypothetical protein N7474_004868 [Penicillium riverlandense]
MSATIDRLSRVLRDPSPTNAQYLRNALILAASVALGTAIMLPTAIRDYRIFKSYGEGGPPSNILGWIVVRGLFEPFRREMFSTTEYERAEQQQEGFLALSADQLSSRSVSNRPVVGPHVAPQRQLTQIPDPAIMEKLREKFFTFAKRNAHVVKLSESLAEGHTEAIFLADHLPASPIFKATRGEIAHVHTGKDHSLHMVLSPVDCKKLIEAGWAQRHSFSGSWAMSILSFGTRSNIPSEYMLVYAPRTEAEVETVMAIVVASVKFATGEQDIR